MTRPDLPVAAWPTADHSVGASPGFESGLVAGWEGCDGELWESARERGVSITKRNGKDGMGHTSEAVSGRRTVFEIAVELMHVQLRVHMWKIDFGCFCRDQGQRVSNDQIESWARPEPAHHTPQTRHIDGRGSQCSETEQRWCGMGAEALGIVGGVGRARTCWEGVAYRR